MKFFMDKQVSTRLKFLEKISRGDRSVSLYGSGQNEMFRLDLDVDFEDLIERK